MKNQQKKKKKEKLPSSENLKRSSSHNSSESLTGQLRHSKSEPPSPRRLLQVRKPSPLSHSLPRASQNFRPTVDQIFSRSAHSPSSSQTPPRTGFSLLASPSLMKPLSLDKDSLPFERQISPKENPPDIPGKPPYVHSSRKPSDARSRTSGSSKSEQSECLLEDKKVYETPENAI